MIGHMSVLLRQASKATLVSLLAVCAAAALAGLVALGLRFARRGPARFWLAPAFTTLALVPIACGAALWAAGVGRTAEAAVILASPGSLAVRAGLAEAVLPLIMGALAAFGVALLGLLLLAIGRRREDAPAVESASPAAPAAAALLGFCALALVLGVLVNAGAAQAAYAVGLARVLAWTAGVFTLVLLVAAVPLALFAPRGPAPQLPRVLALAVPAGVAGIALAGAGLAAAFVASVMTSLESPSRPTAALERSLPPPPLLPTPTADGSGAIGSEAPAPPPAIRLRVGTDVREPRKLVHVPPRYPEIARQARVQGKVILECVVGPDGRVTDIEVKRGVPLLDDAAREAVRQWRYEPTLLNGVAVPVIMTVSVNFALR